MKLLFAALTVILITRSTPTFSRDTADSTRIVSFQFLRAVLKDLARLDELVKDGKADSVTIVNLKAAYAELQVALDQCQVAIKEGAVISADDERLLGIASARIKTLERKLGGQKFLKWLGWGVAVFFAYLVAHQAAK